VSDIWLRPSAALGKIKALLEMAIHTRMAPAADKISYVNYPKFFEIFRGDFTAVQMEKNQ
jgi:hypothetical protein